MLNVSQKAEMKVTQLYKNCIQLFLIKAHVIILG